MTTPATDGDVRVFDSIENGAPGSEETGRARSAGAREDHSKIEVTDRDGKLSRFIDARRVALAGWWLRTARPPSYGEAWRQSAFDPSRVPSGAPWWVPWLWRVSNWSDRLLWFAVTAPLPGRLRSTVRWVPARHAARIALVLARWAAVRPTRRLGTYLLLAVVLAAVRVG